MPHKIFIAINLPENIKNKLAEYQEKWPDLPARWTKKENLHITLEFLGYLTNEELIELCQKTKEIVSGKKAFSLRLNKICYGPPHQSPEGEQAPYGAGKLGTEQAPGKKPPRMIWVTGEKVKEFHLTPHITLGRIKTWQFRQIEPEERPEINEEINLSFEVNSIEVMESRLKRGQPKYTVLGSFELTKN